MISSYLWNLLILAAILPYLHQSEANGDEQGASNGQADGRPYMQAGPPAMSLENLSAFLTPEDFEPLYLSPYIENCTYELGRNKSKIALAEMLANVSAYSGYITVNTTSNSNLFFLLVEAEGNSSTAPLLLWTQGGPGLSALFGQFLQNGPIAFTGIPPLYLSRRQKTLQKNMSVLYIDVPVGAGFSFTDSEDGYPKSLEDVTESVITFLKQFLQLFSYYNQRDFYLAGESYGARYSVAIADCMLKNKSIVSLNLKGVIGGNGFLGPVLEVANSSDFLYQMSMLDMQGYKRFAGEFSTMKQMSESGNETLKTYALYTLLRTIFTSETEPTLFQNLTLYSDHASPMTTTRPLIMLMCFGFLSTNITKAILHAGVNNTFQINNNKLLTSFASDWLRDISEFNEYVLNNSRVLFYTGQIDALFPSVNQRTYFKRLNWTHAVEYGDAVRHPWKPHEKYYGFAGYVKTVNGFTDAVLLGMSHYGAAEKPDEVYHLMTEFIANSSKVLSIPAVSQQK
ncbi:putative serine carboxypeptidase CPVL [Dermacentor variabilis]|uniref:putative serine carboxypeptidase CPVL n=1 Tax=Dermacentor variabilis TaxID=34621 RepID=UPI003F5C5D52